MKSTRERKSEHGKNRRASVVIDRRRQSWETHDVMTVLVLLWSAIFCELRNVFMSLQAAASGVWPIFERNLLGLFRYTRSNAEPMSQFPARKLIRIVNTFQKTGLKKIKKWMIPKVAPLFSFHLGLGSQETCGKAFSDTRLESASLISTARVM